LTAFFRKAGNPSLLEESAEGQRKRNDKAIERADKSPLEIRVRPLSENTGKPRWRSFLAAFSISRALEYLSAGKTRG
jgi:hypothetical protein